MLRMRKMCRSGMFNLAGPAAGTSRGGRGDRESGIDPNLLAKFRTLLIHTLCSVPLQRLVKSSHEKVVRLWSSKGGSEDVIF